MVKTCAMCRNMCAACSSIIRPMRAYAAAPAFSFTRACRGPPARRAASPSTSRKSRVCRISRRTARCWRLCRKPRSCDSVGACLNPPASEENRLIDRPLAIGAVEREGGNLYVEMLTLVGDHAVTAGHEARRRRQRNAARVFEGIARLEPRLFPDDARSLHLLQPAGCIRDAPVARLQLDCFLAEIADVDRVSPEEIAAIRLGALAQKARRHGHLDVTGHGAVHRIDCQKYAVRRCS